MIDAHNDIPLAKNETVQVDVEADLDSAIQILAELKDYFGRLNALRADNDTSFDALPNDRAARYHELDV